MVTAAVLSALASACGGACAGAPASGVDPRGERPTAGPAAVDDGVVVRLARLHEGGPIAFGVPLPRAAVADAAVLRLRDARTREPVAGATLAPTLFFYDPSGKRTGVRAVRVELPAGALAAALGATRDVELTWRADAAGLPAPGPPAPGAGDALVAAPEIVEVVDREVAEGGGGYHLVEKPRPPRLLHEAWEPRALPRFPDGYLATTGLFGELLPSAALEADPSLSSLRFYSDAARGASRAVTFDLGYTVSAYPGTGKKDEGQTAAVVDPVANFEAWLYDRCATLLVVAAHLDDPKLYRHGLRACSFYASQIDERGLFRLKLDEHGKAWDDKYSHARGLYLYFALTGDPRAAKALAAIAGMWDQEEMFARPYRKGKARGPDKLWTERQLAAALEAAVYGFLLTGEARHLTAAKELFESAFAHITAKDAEAIRAITGHALPPQDCLVHSSGQHEGGEGVDPWCSPWMSALLAEPLLRFQELTGDKRVDEVFVRLGRFLRDRGAMYFSGDPKGDSFLAPSMCFDPATQGESPRFLFTVYGAGLKPDGSRSVWPDWDDFNHCPDVSLLSALALRGLRRTGGWDRPGPAPFTSEGQSILALHHELAYCSFTTFKYYVREQRDPRIWTSDRLAEGYGKPGWVVAQKIGWPTFDVSPLRKYGWWFNGSLETWAILREAGLDFKHLNPGGVQPKGMGCPAATRF